MLNAKNKITGASPIMTPLNKILIALTAFLIILYVLSFTRSCTSNDSREKIKTAKIKKKYLDSIKSFELSDATGSLTLKYNGSFWTAGTLPASAERIQKLIENLITVRNLYKISDKITDKSAFGLTTGTEFHLRYYTNDTFHELIFGNQDFSLSSRYLMTEKSTQVYEIDTSLDTYLTTSIQNWAEPYIISQTVLGKIKPQDVQRTQVNDVQKLLELRHGGAPNESELLSILNNSTASENPDTTITLELGNKNEIELKIYKSTNENEFIVRTEYKKQKDDKPVYISYSRISAWTYSKIKEIIL